MPPISDISYDIVPIEDVRAGDTLWLAGNLFKVYTVLVNGDQIDVALYPAGTEGTNGTIETLWFAKGFSTFRAYTAEPIKVGDRARVNGSKHDYEQDVLVIYLGGPDARLREGWAVVLDTDGDTDTLPVDKLVRL